MYFIYLTPIIMLSVTDWVANKMDGARISLESEINCERLSWRKNVYQIFQNESLFCFLR